MGRASRAKRQRTVYRTSIGPVDFPTRCADPGDIIRQIGGAPVLDAILGATEYVDLPCDCGNGPAGLAFTTDEDVRVEIWLRWDDTYVVRMRRHAETLIATRILFDVLTPTIVNGHLDLGLGKDLCDLSAFAHAVLLRAAKANARRWHDPTMAVPGDAAGPQ